MIKFNKLILLAITVVSSAISYKILLAGPQFGSHVFKLREVGVALIEAGHEVYLVLESKFDPKFVKKVKDEGFNVKVFEKRGGFPSYASEEFKNFILDGVFNVPFDYKGHVELTIGIFEDECGFMMGDLKFVRELEGVGFDLAVAEPFILHMCHLLLPKYLKIPFVSMSFNYNLLKIRSPGLPSFSPRHWFSKDIHKDATFFTRFSMLLGTLYLSTGLSPINTNLTLLRKYAPGISSYEDLLRESLLFFYEVDHHFNNFISNFPNHVSVAGLTCSPAKNLPENILNFINGRIVDGKDPGVILMSFGSFVDYMPTRLIEKFFNVFKSLNETVLVKYKIKQNDTQPKPTIPANVMILDWLPQNDVLGLPSTKLFITHCGNNGQHEALYHGVPMLGFPLFAEQDENARKVIALEFGLIMDMLTFTEKELLENILEMLRNPKYKNNIQRMSEAFRDQPMTARQKALFWIEHVIKHGGSHLRCSAMDLPLYQFLCFDTVGLLVFIFISIFTLTLKIFIFTFKKVLQFYETLSCRFKLKQM